MKILMVSMSSLHFFRWVEQLKDSGHEVYWFDINDGGEEISKISWVNQVVNWKNRYRYPGYYFLKNKIPFLFRFLQFFNERNIETEFEKVIKSIQPDVVQSIVMYSCCVPIYPIMIKNPQIKWIYSAWGNDLYYYRNIPEYKKDILKVLPTVDYMFADCNRDIIIAKELGFQGKKLGVFPGGGGYKLNEYSKYKIPFNERKIILVKGFEQRFGRAINVIKALIKIKNELKDYKVVVFGADKQFYLKFECVSDTDFIDVKGKISHIEVLKLMGKSLIYIGNSISDGMPNTLLEAIIMGAYPIQSNPGGATAEIIKDKINGLLIDKCEDLDEISQKIILALSNNNFLQEAFDYNKKLQLKLDFKYIRDQVLEKYILVESKL